MEAEGRARLYNGGFRSSDQMEGPISNALRKAGLHYSSVFTSIAVYSPSENPHDKNTPAYRAFGPPVILRESVLADIVIACSVDFQNAVSNRRNPREVFLDLRNKPPEEIRQLLLAIMNKRPSYTWTEARIYRLLTLDDVLEDRYRNATMI